MGARFRSIGIKFMTERKELQEAELSTGLPLRLAYLAITAQADRRGVLPADPTWLDEHAAPLDHWPWVDIIECFVAMAFVDPFEVAQACEGETSFMSIIGWNRLQSIMRSEKPRWPAPNMVREHLAPTPLPASLMRRDPQAGRICLPEITSIAQPQAISAVKSQSVEDLRTAIAANGNAPQPDPLKGVDDLVAQGIGLEVIAEVSRKDVGFAPRILKSWADPWLMPLYRRELNRAD